MPPAALYVLVWVFAVGPKEHSVVFGDKISRIECKSKVTELKERERRQHVKTTYSRFVCVPLPE